MRVLDLAAGPGVLTSVLLAAGAASVVWHDVNPQFLEVARRQVKDPEVEFELRDMLDLPYPPASFDAVVLREALYWASDEAQLIARLGELVRPGGWVVIRAFNWRRSIEMVRPWWKAAAHLVTPVIARVLGSKRLPTLWVFERATRARLERAEFDIVEWTRRRRRDFVVVARKRGGKEAGF